jgi:hypothetical protein
MGHCRSSQKLERAIRRRGKGQDARGLGVPIMNEVLIAQMAESRQQGNTICRKP